MPEDGISDGELLRRLSMISGEAFVAGGFCCRGLKRRRSL